MGDDETRVKPMFPIIYLTAQLEVINNYIHRYQLKREAIYHWLSHYGELVKPHEESSLRTGRHRYYVEIPPIPYIGIHIYRTHLGFRNAFRFIENNFIKIDYGMGEIQHYNGYKKWIRE
jgi:hypothetical protein